MRRVGMFYCCLGAVVVEAEIRLNVGWWATEFGIRYPTKVVTRMELLKRIVGNDGGVFDDVSALWASTFAMCLRKKGGETDSPPSCLGLTAIWHLSSSYGRINPLQADAIVQKKHQR